MLAFAFQSIAFDFDHYLWGWMLLILLFCFVSFAFAHSGTPVSTSLGFCLTLLPLLSIGFPSIFGTSEDYFIRTVPLAALSTPEDYLMGMSDARESTVVAKEAPTDMLVNAEDPVTNEETPLL